MLAAGLFAVIVSVRKKWKEIRNWQAIKYLLCVVLFNGVLFYGFYFFGLKYTDPGNAGLIAQMEVLFTFLFFNIWKKEYISRKYLFGVLLMLLGATIVLLPNVKSFNPGDVIVLAAMTFAPIGNHFQQKARKEMSSETMMFTRSFLAFPIIFLLAYLLGDSISLASFRAAWIAVAVNGLLLLGLSKIFWIEGIHRISVTKAVAMGGFIPLLTLFLAWLILGRAPTIFQLSAFLPLFFGLMLLTSRKENLPA